MIDVGVEATPTVARAVAREGAGAGVVITASLDTLLRVNAEESRAVGVSGL